jgi:tetratricopeptide (TPR) repeat protein
MKKEAKILAICLLSSGLCLAQSSKRTTANNALEDFKKYGEQPSLKKAEENIDAAAVHAETGVESKTWFYRGNIYLTAFDNSLKLENEKLKDITDPAKKNMMAYSNVPAADLVTAYESYLKVKQFDKKNIYTEEVKVGLSKIAIHMDNKGVADFNTKKSADAASEFMKSYDISTMIGKADTAALNNAAMSYRGANDLMNAKTTYQKLIDMNFGKAKTVNVLANLLIKENDTAAAGVIIRKGRIQYPNDLDLLTTETDYLLRQKKNAAAINNLKRVIEMNPNDAHLYLVAGSVYDRMANAKDDKGKIIASPAEFDQFWPLAESNYKKAVELKSTHGSDYFESLYNLGALYYNQAIIHYDKGNSLKDVKQSAAESKEADELFKKALPFLEKAHEVNPKDQGTMQTLKLLYAKTEQQAKYDKIVSEIKAN